MLLCSSKKIKINADSIVFQLTDYSTLEYVVQSEDYPDSFAYCTDECYILITPEVLEALLYDYAMEGKPEIDLT